MKRLIRPFSPLGSSIPLLSSVFLLTEVRARGYLGTEEERRVTASPSCLTSSESEGRSGREGRRRRRNFNERGEELDNKGMRDAADEDSRDQEAKGCLRTGRNSSELKSRSSVKQLFFFCQKKCTIKVLEKQDATQRRSSHFPSVFFHPLSHRLIKGKHSKRVRGLPKLGELLTAFTCICRTQP